MNRKMEFQLPEKELNELASLLESGAYSNMNELVVDAIRDFLQKKENNGMTVDASAITSDNVNKFFNGSLAASKRRDSNQTGMGIPNQLILSEMENSIEELETVEPVEPDDETEWPWGQFNRIFPIKTSLRVLGASLAKANGQLELEDYRNELRNMILDFVPYLKVLDERKDNSGSDRLTIGFPKGDDKNSIRRFLNHFGMEKNGKNKFGGALAEFGLANLEGNEIHPTDLGLEFCLLSNPILDDGDSRTTSTEEIEFYFEKILEYHPGEQKAFQLIKEGITSGSNTPSSLKEFVKNKMNNDWSKTFLKTQVNGAVSRMADLGLIKRKKHGRKVTYRLQRKEVSNE